jgi:hypothetical protein
MRARWLLVPLAVVSLVGCSSSSKDDDAPSKGASASSTSTTTSSTTTSTSTTTTVPFAGATDPVELPVGTEHTALLTDVTVTHVPGIDRVTFRFRGPGVPGVHVEYVTRPTEDGSGAAVKVEGAAYLQVRLSPAAGADLTGEEAKPSYTGPARVRAGGTKAVTEVVRAGDFEGVLSWVVGVRTKAPFRLATTPDPSQVVLELAAP